jgi:hypothetical protein
MSSLHLEDNNHNIYNPITTSINNSILNKLNSNNIDDGIFRSINGRTSIGTADYNSLISRGWTLMGLDLITPPTPVPTQVGVRFNNPNI